MSKTYRNQNKKIKMRCAKENKSSKSTVKKKLMNDYFQFRNGEEELQLENQQP